ncbi:hypothetical protein BJP34_31680 [Moorena producens PAL-8-15-08-1]|uniref:Secreted protein n=1 Tax=Moorena producens PAL-8-15-08-1 TaxID=1458985 RepID=A0A1D8U132_9CYAN|nr:hypothetical protein [Moorena producens]AOX03396.1 hypothetical protein BJP34_31680 [Moorena producens PAL-8-15-08-1]
MRNQFGKSLVISALTAVGVAAGATSAFAQVPPGPSAPIEQDFEFEGTVEGTCSFVDVQPGALTNPNPEVLAVVNPGDYATGLMLCNSPATISLGDLMATNDLSQDLLDTAETYNYGVSFTEIGGATNGEIKRTMGDPAAEPLNLPPSEFEVEADMEIVGLLPLEGGDYAFKFTVTATAN